MLDSVKPIFDVFLSYHHGADAFVKRLKTGLTERFGLRCWLDHERMGAGDSLVGGIDRGIGQSRAIVVVLSDGYGRTGWTEAEYQVAMQRCIELQIPVFPVIVEKSQPMPPLLQREIHVDFSEPADFGGRLDDLGKAICSKLQIAPPKEDRVRELRGYFERMEQRTERVGMADFAKALGVDTRNDQELKEADRIERLYVPARVSLSSGGGHGIRVGESESFVSLPEFLSRAQRRMFILLGDPGWGKTTAMRYLVYRLACHHKEFENDWVGSWRGNLPEPEVEDWGAELRACAPVFIELKRLARWLERHSLEGRGPQVSLERFEAFLLGMLAEPPFRFDDTTARAVFAELMRSDGSRTTLFVLDGLDEAHRPEYREAVLLLAGELAGAGYRVVLTCRVRPWAEEGWGDRMAEQDFPLPSSVWSLGTIALFDDDEAIQFVRNWFGDKTQADDLVRSLGLGEDAVVSSNSSGVGSRRLGSVYQAAESRTLTHTPLLLSLLILWFERRAAKTDWSRLELYEDLCRMLLVERDSRRELNAIRPSAEGGGGEELSLEELLWDLPEFAAFGRLAALNRENATNAEGLAAEGRKDDPLTAVRLAGDRLLWVVGHAAFHELVEGGEQARPKKAEEDYGEVSRSRLAEAALIAFRGGADTPRDRLWADAVLRTLQFRERLIVDRSGEATSDSGRLTFPHRTFLEYLAGRYLADETDVVNSMVGVLSRLSEDSLRNAITVSCEIRRWEAKGRDTETDKFWIRQILDVCARKPGSKPGTFKGVHAWKDARKRAPAGVLEQLAGEILLACYPEPDKEPEEDRRWIDMFRGYEGGKEGLLSVALSDDTNIPPPIRLRIGRCLGWLGDRRPGVGVRQLEDGLQVPDLVWVPIRESGDPGKPPDFFVSPFPVTVAQYRCFARSKESGYDDVTIWKAGGFDDRESDPEARALRRGIKFPVPNQPMVYVNWYEAVAFCAWVTRLRLNWAQTISGEQMMHPDSIVRLPNDQEWTRFAAGSENRRYPWGDSEDSLENRMNYSQSGFRSPSPVGLYPIGAAVESGQKIFDLAGNVDEWTESMEGSIRVLRGGSWFHGAENCRSAFRYRIPPGPPPRPRRLPGRPCSAPWVSSMKSGVEGSRPQRRRTIPTNRSRSGRDPGTEPRRRSSRSDF